MDLSIIAEAIKAHPDPNEFEIWIGNHERQLSNYFYGLNGNNLNNISFDQFYYRVIAQSKVYNQYINSSLNLPEFDYFIGLISDAAAKLAEIGLDSLAQTIVADMPNSPSRFRLMALNDFSLVDDIRIDYLSRLPDILKNLKSSLSVVDDDGIRKVVDVLNYYLKKTKSTLQERGFDNIYAQIKSQFRNPALIAEFDFLEHQILVDILDDKDPFALYPVEIDRDRLEPSDSIQELFKNINFKYFNHPRIYHEEDNLWGYSKDHVLQVVIDRGKCDFSADYGEITAEDKVTLYCFYNMKKHLFTSYAVFQTVLESLTHFFELDHYKPVFIDLGCGPMTSGIALADIIHTRTKLPVNLSYIGVDIAPAMLAKCEEFKTLDIFSPDCFFSFVLNWNDIDPSLINDLAGKNNPIVFNASYLFASRSVDALNLSKYINGVAKNFENVYFVFQNPDRRDRNVKYEEFKTYIKYITLINKVEDIRYKAASRESHEEVLYEILKLS